MTHRRSTLVLLALLSLLLAARGVPTTEEIRQMLADKQHKRVLREVARALHLKGDDAAAYDRGELLLLRAEAQLGMRIEPAAARSFKEAAEAATRDEHRATGRAMALLIARSELLVYRPRTGEGAGRDIDIVADRKAALEALLADELALLEPRVARAKEKKKIADVLETAKAVEPVAELEFAATGGRKRTDELRGGIVTQVEALLDEALIDLDRKADAIEAGATALVVVPQSVAPGKELKTVKVKKRGLTTPDEAALKGTMEACRDVVSRNREVAEQLGADPQRFGRASDFAIRLSAKAGAILRADYGEIEERPLDAAPPAPASGEPTVGVGSGAPAQ
jgi:hypothetical protein